MTVMSEDEFFEEYGYYDDWSLLEEEYEYDSYSEIPEVAHMGMCWFGCSCEE